MGSLDSWIRAAQGNTPNLDYSLSPPSTSGSSSGGTQPANTKTAIEKFDLNKFFDSATGAGADIFSTAGQLPAKVYETPFAVADVVARQAGLPEPGKALGGLLGPVGEGLNRVSNFVPALINSHEAKVWGAVYNLPDSTPLNADTLAKALGFKNAAVARQLGFGDQYANGWPVLGLLGIGGHTKTVGELRGELQKRGFFNDEKTGQALNPVEVGKALSNGQSGIFDYGHAATNDNALVNLATRLATDPTNILLFTPAGEIAAARLGELAFKVLPAGEAIQRGLTVAKVLSPLRSAEEIAAGVKQAYGAGPAIATLKGLATLYQKGAVTLAAGTYGLNAVSNLTGGQKGPLGWLNAATDAILSDQPLSKNSAFTLFSAVSFPYGKYVKGAMAAVGKGKVRAIGANDFGRIVDDAGGYKPLVDTIGGDANLQTLGTILDANILQAKGRFDPYSLDGVASAPHGASALELTSPIVARAIDKARKAGEITPEMRYQEFRRMAAEGAGTAGTPAVNIYDPMSTIGAWAQHIDARRAAEPTMRQLAVAVSDRNTKAGGSGVIFREQVDAGTALFKGEAIGKGKDATVPKSVIHDFLEEHANVRALDPRPDFWDKALNPRNPDPSLRSVLSKMRALRQADGITVKMADYFGPLAQHEKGAPTDPTIPQGPANFDPAARLQELQGQLEQIAPKPNGKPNGSAISPENVQAAQAIQREMEQIKAKLNGVEWAGIGEFDKRQGVDPTITKTMDEAAQAALPDTPLPEMAPGIDKFTPEQQAQVLSTERAIYDIAPRLTLKRAPVMELLNQVLPEDAATIQRLRYYNALGDWLNQSGPIAPISRFAQALTRPVGRAELQRDALQEMQNVFMPLGVKPKQLRTILNKLDETVQNSVVSEKFGIRMYRDIGSLLPAQMEKIAYDSLHRLMAEGKGVGEAVHPAVARIQAEGGFYRLFQKANSRYWRTVSRRAAEGGKGSQLAAAAYQVWDRSPLAGPQHAFAKSIYPVFRFMADPRWWLMNRMEAEVYAFTKAGIGKGYREAAQQGNLSRAIVTKDFGGALSEGGQMFTRNTTALAAKWLDKEANRGLTGFLNEMGHADPAIRKVRIRMAEEGQRIMDTAKSQLADGTIDAARHAELVARGKHLQDLSNRDLAAELNQSAYATSKGAKQAVMEEAKLQFDPAEMDVVAPLLDKIAQNASEQWSHIQSTLHGNPARSTVERILNSPLLFWPLSYQIKATKWLADVMLNGSFGHNNNALLAGVYANWMQQHQEQMKKNPAYQAFYQANPEQWFTAQMLLPIGPGDIGVSLGKLTDLAGTAGQEKVNQWLGTDIGAFTAQKFNDPAQALGWLTKLGPMYTADLAANLIREAGWTDIWGAASPSSGPAPKTAHDILGGQPIQQGVPFAHP